MTAMVFVVLKLDQSPKFLFNQAGILALGLTVLEAESACIC